MNHKKCFSQSHVNAALITLFLFRQEFPKNYVIGEGKGFL